MENLLDHPIARRWPPARPDAIQIYSFPTPNGIKVAVALEELELPYEAHRVSIMAGDQKTDAFLALNPNGKIPAIVDPDGPGGRPIGLFESGAILVYLAEKTGRLLPAGPERYEVLAWLMFQMGGVGPMIGQLNFFAKFGGVEIEDPRPRQRYRDESERLLSVVEGRLAERQWIAGDYSIADIALAPWLRALRTVYESEPVLDASRYPATAAYLGRWEARPAVQRGLNVPPR